MNTNLTQNIETLTARVLLASMFIIAGSNKISAWAGTQGYMEAMGVPGELLPLVVILQIGAGLGVLLGICTRTSAWALAVFCIVAALLFHADFSDQMQSILFMKNLAISGGLIALASHGAGQWSIDHLRSKRA